MSDTALDLLLIALPVAFTMFVVLNFGGILGWVERKQSAIMQDRIGANRASIFGIRVLCVLAMLSLGVYGLMMAGCSSANNYALLGAQRAAALMISAEIAIGASIMGVVMEIG